MEYMKIDGQFPGLSNCAVTLGKFDGIHRGHRLLIGEILKHKEENSAISVVLALGSGRQMILTADERRELLKKLGVDVLLECPLSERMRHMKAEDFIRQILVGDLKASFVVVGEDNRFGFERKGTPQLLKKYSEKYGYETMVFQKEMDGNRKISSTYVREELKKGNMEKVSQLLGGDFFVSGRVEHGRGLGHKDFFPTANLIPPAEKLLPPNGVYATLSDFDGKLYPGVTNIGYKPTVGENFIGVETNLFDFSRDLYGRFCKVYFCKYLRAERKFTSFEALKIQIGRDAEQARQALSAQISRNRSSVEI